MRTQHTMQRDSRALKRRMRGNFLFGPMFFIGMLAGISVPAYQDYTIRAQASEGLKLAAELKAAVTEIYAATGKWPRDLRELKYEAVPSGEYVTFAAVNRGTIVIRYSSAAGAPLRRQQLTLRPTLSAGGDVVWSCGYTDDQGEDPESGAASPHATTVAAKYLPSSCRG
jgi:type IV pilus assembly protein PilA